jgi:hypothetical protein
MWALRVLTGPQTGQTFDLKMGRNIIGRGSHCDVKILSQGVSKEHSEIHVYKDKIMVVDLKSSNGTFVNGVKIQNGLVRLGDKVSVHDVFFDIIPSQDLAMASVKQAPVLQTQGSAALAPQPSFQPEFDPGFASAAPQMMGSISPSMGVPPESLTAKPEGFVQGLVYQFSDYIERVALPGVYKLAQFAEFKFILGGFVVIFIFAVTMLSMIPMIQITRSSVLNESMRRAQSIARNLAMANQQLLIQGSYSSLTTQSAETEDGIKQVMIVQQSDGMILAPASKAGTTPNIPFVHSARREMKSQVAQLDSQTIAASFPIGQYDPNTGEPSVKAHAIVIYDIGSLAFDDGHVLSLFFQTLIIASIVGLILFFFMYKLIEYPINSLNDQLDVALREKRDSTEVSFHFPALQNLIGNINSLLSRYLHGDQEQGNPLEMVSRDGEAENLIQLMGYPTIAISGENRIISVNSNFEQLSHASSAQLSGQAIASIPDGALQQNIQHLIQKSREVPGTIHTDSLEFAGHNCQIHCHAMGVEKGTVSYFVISVTPTEGGD